MKPRLGRFLASALACFLATSSAQAAPDEAALAKARELLQVMHSTELMDQMLVPVVDQLGEVITKFNPDKGALVVQFLNEAFLPEMRGRLPEVIDQIAGVYAQHYSAEELDELLRFYDTPVGQKLVATTPQVVTEIQAVGRAWGIQVARETLQKLHQMMEQRGLQSPPI